ncbi:hypothetical protein [Streptomyces aureocirculatus]|uniref:hypothetical protein n=1 Tax=Streptomyces aureocirculatus TaxID=67275 RepID=UPI0004CC5454|nr:hypothetical protein [Streptomyces aureocirculatus]
MSWQPAPTPEPIDRLWFFMLQFYVFPAAEQTAEWVDTADRFVELKPRRDDMESDPAAGYCVRHMKAHMRNGEARCRMVVHAYVGRTSTDV